MTSPSPIAAALKSEAISLGFELVGITSNRPSPNLSRFHQWIDQGLHGEMAYLADRRDAYADPNRVLEGCRSIVMLGLPYKSPVTATEERGSARVASYASGSTDYHDLIHARLKTWTRGLRERFPEEVFRGVVDSAPLLERDYAQLSGLGWIGKNTLLLNKQAGSYFFLAALLTSLKLPEDAPFTADHCGTCTACLDACPTDAFIDARHLDATKCISYLTIEKRSAIDSSLALKMEDWIFGCDVCQSVCPWNTKPPATDEPDLQPLSNHMHIEVGKILVMDDETFRRDFRKTPMWRTKLSGMQRNALIVAVNQGLVELLPAVNELATRSPYELVQSTARWAAEKLQET
jgi:epoxyqueuosine reductase